MKPSNMLDYIWKQSQISTMIGMYFGTDLFHWLIDDYQKHLDMGMIKGYSILMIDGEDDIDVEIDPVQSLDFITLNFITTERKD